MMEAQTIRLLCCDADAGDLDMSSAMSAGWSFATVRGIAACPRHSIACLDANLARIAQAYGWTVDDLHTTELPIDAPLISEIEPVTGARWRAWPPRSVMTCVPGSRITPGARAEKRIP